jgi:hypothetical protein
VSHINCTASSLYIHIPFLGYNTIIAYTVENNQEFDMRACVMQGLSMLGFVTSICRAIELPFKKM